MSSDPFYIFDHFDTFFSLVENGSSVGTTSLIRGSDLIYLTIDKLGKILTTFLQSNEPADKDSYLNLIKMLFFLNVGFVGVIDKELLASSESTGGRKNNKKLNSEFDVHDWENRRYKILIQIYNVMQLPIEKLWNQCIAEEEFVK